MGGNQMDFQKVFRGKIWGVVFGLGLEEKKKYFPMLDLLLASHVWSTSPTKRRLNSGQIQLAPWVFQPMMVWGTDPEMMCQADLAQTPNTPLSFRNPETRSVRNNLGVEIRPQRRVKNGLTCSVYFNFCQFRKYTNHTYYHPHITSSLKAQNHPPNTNITKLPFFTTSYPAIDTTQREDLKSCQLPPCQKDYGKLSVDIKWAVFKNFVTFHSTTVDGY